MQQSFRAALLASSYLTGAPIPAFDKYIRGYNEMIVGGGDIRDIIWSPSIVHELDDKGFGGTLWSPSDEGFGGTLW